MSTIQAANFSDGTSTIPGSYVVNGSSKAWVNFNGTGTIAARGSLNVSSLTDLGVGQYTVNLANAFAAADYAVVNGASYSDAIGAVAQLMTPRYLATASFRAYAEYNNGAFVDFDNCFLVTFGDLA